MVERVVTNAREGAAVQTEACWDNTLHLLALASGGKPVSQACPKTIRDRPRNEFM
jgi:hypothetical protein